MLIEVAVANALTQILIRVGKIMIRRNLKALEKKTIMDIDGPIGVFKDMENDTQFNQSDRNTFRRVRRKLENLRDHHFVDDISYADLKQLLKEYDIDLDET